MKKWFDIDWNFHFNATMAMLWPLILLKTTNKQFVDQHPFWAVIIFAATFYFFPKYLRAALDRWRRTRIPWGENNWK